MTALAVMLFGFARAHATTGINQTINFQGRLLNSAGATVPDGFYNLEFKIYVNGNGQNAGDTGGSPAGTLDWTEDYLNNNSQGVQVVNGFFSVNLGSINPFGSSINWNQDTLWLSMNVGSTGASCTPFSSCTPDGEMLPMQRLTASPYALNSGQLGGLTSSQYVQLGQGVQSDSTTNSSIFINKTASGNLLELQSSGSDAFVLSNSGNQTFGNNATSHSIGVATAAASTAGVSLSVTAGAAGSGASALSGGNLTLQGGTGGGTNGNGGNVNIIGGTPNGTGTNGNISLQAEGITESINSSGTAPSDTIQTTTNSATAFQIENSSSKPILSVDTTNNRAVVGQANGVNGAILFNNSASANGITLNSTAATSSYTLTLPSAAPNAGLCIETSNSSASQLVFASCSNTNASITEVAEWDANATNSVTISPSNIGDEIILTTQIPTSSVTVSSISGGGVTTWTKAVVNSGNGTVNRVEMWVGTVTATGSSAITVTYSSSPGTEEIAATEFTAAGVNAATTWGVDSTGSQINSASTTVTFPSLTSVSSDELYYGYGQVQNPPSSAGSSSGFNYIVTSTQHNIITYNQSTNANTSYQPTASQSSSGQSNVISAILTAFVTSTAINNSTSVQQANYYVQAAASGSVAGVLQAASSGTADVLDLRNSSGTNIATFGYNGITTLKNSTNSSTAFQVQNTGGNSVLGVNTSNNTVSLGAATNIAGDINFFDTSDSNSIGLAAPTSIAASYTLTLPQNTPTAGLCLGTSPSNANQLIFASCATQVSVGAISYVGEWDAHNGSGVTTLSDSPSNVGDLLTFYSRAANNVTVSTVSGGGVTTWTKITSTTYNANAGVMEMWRGIVTTAGAATITVTYSGAEGSNEIAAQEFTMHSTSSTWAIDNSGNSTNGTGSTSTTVSFPSLTPTNSSELYTGFSFATNTESAGSTSGYSYVATGATKYFTYNTNVTGGSAQAPTASQTAAGYYTSVAAEIAGYTGTSVIVNTTSTQQANFNVQAASSGTVAGVLQAASSGTADIFDARDKNGNNIAAINASSGLTLGTLNTVGGQLVFNDSGNNNAVTIAAPATAGSSYSLILPSTTPAAGECLASSPSNANQLVFSSCANQVTSVAISYVTGWKETSSGQSQSLTDSPVTVGDLITLFIYASKGNSVTSISGGGVSAWELLEASNAEEMYRGTVTSTGSNTISVSLSTPASPTVEMNAQEWTTGSTNGSWAIDASGSISNAASTTVTYPSLTPNSTKDLYVGFAVGTSTMSAGSTSGYTYTVGAETTNYVAYNTSISAATQPTASQSTSGTSLGEAALIAAYSSSSVIANSTVTQSANFNVQAATSGSVAGVLQAFGGGTGDIFDAQNGTGTLVDSIGYTGNLLVEPSTASASALRVQTTGGVNVFSVDTSGLAVNIGAGATGEATPSLLVLDSETGTSADPTEVDGGLYYNVTTKTFRCGVDGSWQTCTGLLYSNTSASSAVSNCSSACTAFSTAAAVPANYCQTGRVIEINDNGYYSTSGAGSTLQFGVYYGTSSTNASSDTLIGALTPSTTTTSANNYYYQINYNLICFSTSSIEAEGTLNIQTTSSNTTDLLTLPIASTTATTVTSNVAKNLYIFPIWGTASTSNTVTATQMIVNSY